MVSNIYGSFIKKNIYNWRIIALKREGERERANNYFVIPHCMCEIALGP